MSCSKIDDLEDLAANIFEFEPADEAKEKAQRERMLKKQQRRDKIKMKQEAEEEEKQQEEQDDTEVDFFVQAQEKVPGTHNIYVKTFGCSHNISDSQFMIGQLVDYGYNIVNSPQLADLILINSCTVKNPSQDAFISMVCRAKKIKKPVVVAGCVPQGDQNIPELSEISALGVTQIDKVVHVVEETLKGYKVQLMEKKALPSLDLPKIRKNKDIEIIPINAGCLGACTYCKTVFARGKLLSYAPEAITSRVSTVVKQGVKEIWLTSEDTGAYGRDINSNISELLISLCEQLKNNEHQRIMMRIGMTNPPYILDHLHTIAQFLNHPRVYSFIHIPVQAGHNNVLDKMNREYTVEQFRTVCDFMLEHVPDVTIATDIICGFAEETEEEFEASMDLVRHYKFKVLYINQFYLRPGTPAANLKQLPSNVIKDRSTRISNLFKSMDHYSHMVGRTERVWINEVEEYKNIKHLVGHTKNYTKVNIPYDESLLYKQALVRITQAFDWHVEGEILDRDLEPLEVSDSYVMQMKRDIENEKAQLAEKKKLKLEVLKEKKREIMEKLYEDKDASLPVKQPVPQTLPIKNVSQDVPITQLKPTPQYNNSYLVIAVALLSLALALHLLGY